jgi:hypothetical protein
MNRSTTLAASTSGVTDDQQGRELLFPAKALHRRNPPLRQQAHLNHYLGEFDSRYSTCQLSDSERTGILINRSVGLLSYKRVKQDKS